MVFGRFFVFEQSRQPANPLEMIFLFFQVMRKLE
jgi:hypothetical protein